MLTARLALGRFRAERWWAKKFDVYTSIIEALDQISAAFYDEIEELRKAQRRDETLRSNDLDEKFKSSDERLSQATGLGEFIISAEAAAELSRFRRALAKDHDSYADYVISSMEAANGCLKNMRRLAREDLNERSFHWVSRALTRAMRLRHR
jgi:hypothetical protein